MSVTLVVVGRTDLHVVSSTYEPKVADQHQDIFPTFAFYILQTVLAYFEKQLEAAPIQLPFSAM